MKNFWENQSLNKNSFIHSASNLTNDSNLSIEKSTIEREKIENLFSSKKRNFNSCLEIGAGTCQWSNTLLKVSKYLLATDTSKGMLDLGKKYIFDNHPNNKIKFYVGDICEENNPQNAPYDLVFISGLLLYLSHNQFEKAAKFISKNTEKGSTLILREPVGINKEYILDNVYSEELKTNYSAIYRTEQKIISTFNFYNFITETNEWLHEQNSKFNRWKQTRLKLISLRKI